MMARLVEIQKLGMEFLFCCQRRLLVDGSPFKLGEFEFLEASDRTIACFRNLLKILPFASFNKNALKPFQTPFIAVLLFLINTNEESRLKVFLKPFNPIPTGHGRNQPIYECHVTTACRNRFKAFLLKLKRGKRKLISPKRP